MAHPQHNFTSNFNGSDGHNAELTLNINGVEKKYTPAGNDQTYNVPGVARIDINLDGADLVQAIQTALDGAATPLLVEMSIYDEEVAYQYIGDLDGAWYFGTCTTNKIVTVAVNKEDGAVNGEQIPVANGVVIVPSDGLNVYSQLRTAIALGQLPVLSYVGANPVYAQYEKTADNGDLIFVGALATASDTYVQYNIYTVSDNNTVTVTTRAASAGGGGTPDDENGFFSTSLYNTPGDGVTESLTLDDFRIKNGTSIHGSNIEFVPTHQEGGIDFGEVYLNPGTYILSIRYTLQWVGNPRGTFAPLVCRVGGQPFDFSFEQENTVITSQIRVVTARQKVAIAFPFDADTPVMGIWVETLSIAQIASNTHPAVVHDTTLAGSGTAGSPLGVTTDAFGKVKDIPTSIGQFRTGDVIPVDGPNGPAKMPKDDLLTETAQHALAGNVAPAFVPNSTTTVAGQLYVYNGSLYIAKEAYNGPWDNSKFELASIENVIENNKKILKIDIADTVYGQNLINKDKLGPLGEWCNYTNGKIESTIYVTTYRHSDYIKVEPNATYARRNSNTIASAGAAFFDKNLNFISGVASSIIFTSPASAAYIIVNINTIYETSDDAVLIKGGTPFAVDAPAPAYYNDFKYSNPAYVRKEYLEENLPEFVTSQNLLNKDKLGPLGEWCNYVNGRFESTQYVTTYKHSNFIPVKPSTSYARRNSAYMYNAGYAAFDAAKTFISGGNSSAVIVAPANCEYLVINIDTTREDDDHALLIESATAYPDNGPVLPYYQGFKYPNPQAPRDYVTVGASDSDFTSVGKAFAFALDHDKYVIIKPGVYDLVAEGISGTGYMSPKKIVGYGAKLVCNLSEEDWNLSPINIFPTYGTNVEIYGLEIECTNCRYCIHDEMGSNVNRTPYHHVFKDLTLTHNSLSSETLIAPDNIGGGFGDGGYIEITNCKMTAAYSRNFAYHSNGYNQLSDCIIQCHSCYFNKRIQLSPAGTPAEGVTNTLYVSDCVFGTNKPTSGATSGGTLVTKAWNNILESELQ